MVTMMMILMVIMMVIRKASIFFNDFVINYGWVGIKSLILLGDIFDSNVYIAFSGNFEQYIFSIFLGENVEFS